MTHQRSGGQVRDELSRRLLSLRTRVALTQLQLAQLVGAHRRSVQNWETGAALPKPAMLQRLIAVFVGRGAFAPGQERVEAEALWQMAMDGSPPGFASFDERWFARVMSGVGAPIDPSASIGSAPTTDAARGAIAPPLIDWGEAIALPTLYGRDADLQTLRAWVVDDHCRVVTLVGLGGIGKSSLALALARVAAPHFDAVVFRSLQHGPPLAELLDRTILAISEQQEVLPAEIADKIGLLVQRLRQRRCLLILDNVESILQPGSLAGVYRDGYADYGSFVQRLGEQAHESCLVLTSREKLAELGRLEGAAAPVRTLTLAGLDAGACERLLHAKQISASPVAIARLAQLYGGNPLALQLVAEPIGDLFGGDVGAFLAAGDAYFSGVGKLVAQQFSRSTPTEQAILYWLAVEREPVPLSTLLAELGGTIAPSRLFAAVESLRRRVLIQRAPGEPSFSMQPIFLEYVTEHFVEAISREIGDARPALLRTHTLIKATGKEHLRRTQEMQIIAPLLRRLAAKRSAVALERQLLDLLAGWRGQPPAEQGYGPGNVVNLLRVLRGHLRGLDLSSLLLRQVHLQGVELQDTSMAGATLEDVLFTDTFGAVTSVSVSHDGRYWAASSRCGEVRVWLAGGRVLHRVWRAHAARTYALAFSPMASVLASGSWDGTVKLWDIDRVALLWAGELDSPIQRVAFSPDGRLLAACGGSSVWIWDVVSGQALQTLSHTHAVASVAWIPDGATLATGDRVGNIVLWSVDQSGVYALTDAHASHTNTVSSLSFAPDGTVLASGGWDGTVKLWRTSDLTLEQALAGHTDRLLRITWSPDGATLAIGGGEQIWLWDRARRSYRAALSGHSAGIWSLAYTPDGASLLSGSEDGTLRVWDSSTDQCTSVFEGHAELLYSLDWSPDGAALVTGGAEALVTLWQSDGSAPPRVLHEHRASVFDIAWSPDGRWVASSDWDSLVHLSSINPDDQPRQLSHPERPSPVLYGLGWSPDGARLAVGTYRRGVHMFEMSGSPATWAATELTAWIRQVVWRPDGTQLAGAGDDGVVYVWDAADGALRWRLAVCAGMVSALAWSPDGGRLAAGSSGLGSRSGELVVWETAGFEQLQRLAGHGRVSALAWLPGGTRLISGNGVGAMRWWDAARGVCERTQAAHQGAVQALRVSRDGAMLASCGDDGAVRLWALPGGSLVRAMRRDRPYERLDLAGVSGLTEAQIATLRNLGARDAGSAAESARC